MWDKKPARVRYIGKKNERLSPLTVYNAYFLEYWQGVRNALHVLDDTGEIFNFNRFEDFEVLSDPDGVLNDDEALVQCAVCRYEGDLPDLIADKVYKAIGCDKNGYYLVMDESWDCYFYPPDAFQVIDDPQNILCRQSIYYSFYNEAEDIRQWFGEDRRNQKTC
ncbi:hypothetical protein [Pseudoramibacter alactolyticus]|uniref:hypothetical protein n=1 Tax=Pseudoramibacter alactolyticus TaxID=113287 RepID=UPI0023565907|nr:hypothetical protein [Pseudoramibacter alactolyticus]MBM6967399.1 hypothetical protein [Pseudoramibacter alactolyticus]